MYLPRGSIARASGSLPVRNGPLIMKLRLPEPRIVYPIRWLDAKSVTYTNLLVGSAATAMGLTPALYGLAPTAVTAPPWPTANPKSHPGLAVLVVVPPGL